MKNSSPRHREPRVLIWVLLIAACALLLFRAVRLAHAEPPPPHGLLIYSIDVEGGQSTLLVGPTGASLLVDTGWRSFGGPPGRDAERIQTAMKDAGIDHIDKVMITHYHVDHVGGVPELVKRVKVGEFLDHGPNREDSDITRYDYAAYLKAIGSTPRRTLRPGDTIDLSPLGSGPVRGDPDVPGLSIVVLTADGDHIDKVPGVKPEVNSDCAGEPKWELDASENPRSVGILVRYGNFSFLDMGDLTKAKEIPLVCPMNLIGRVDLFLVSHHGMDWSNSTAFVNAIAPRVAIMPNGAHKGGSPEAWERVHASPRLQDLYMLHTAEGADAAHNSAEELIANPKGTTAPDGQYFKVVAQAGGSFSVTNSRTGQTKDYPEGK
ncbi:MAG TPA: MBL fold metallo-hydrolase [Terracidiphilus sp.]|nr:MBL fold metallo-hydrolase [Terracidiphilus sp.]